MKELPVLPQRPSELAELEPRRAAIREEWQGIEAEFQRARDQAWQTSQGVDNESVSTLDAAAERLASGAAEPTALSIVPEQTLEKRKRADLLMVADRKLTEKIQEIHARHHRSIAKALRPAHKEAAHRIARALVDLVAANAEEEMLRARAPGGTLPAMTFPNAGKFGPVGGPAQYWRDYAKRHGYWPEDGPAQFSAAAS